LDVVAEAFRVADVGRSFAVQGALSASAASAAPGLTSAAVLKKFAAKRTLFSGSGSEMKP
jgi:hypothetical protein